MAYQTWRCQNKKCAANITAGSRRTNFILFGLESWCSRYGL